MEEDSPAVAGSLVAGSLVAGTLEAGILAEEDSLAADNRPSDTLIEFQIKQRKYINQSIDQKKKQRNHPI